MTEHKSVWDNPTRVKVVLTDEVGDWLKANCFEYAYIEAFSLSGSKKGIVAFAYSADALTFRLTFPSSISDILPAD